MVAIQNRYFEMYHKGRIDKVMWFLWTIVMRGAMSWDDSEVNSETNKDIWEEILLENKNMHNFLKTWM